MTSKQFFSGSAFAMLFCAGCLLISKSGISQEATSKKSLIPNQETAEKTAEIDNQFERQLEKANSNRAELEKAINLASEAQRSAVTFLIKNMPTSDLETLSADFLLNNVRLAFEARERAPWKIPDDVFLNDVLPYANIDEPRDAWRENFAQLCRPMIKGCKTPGEAAQRLNETIFKELGVKYSTARKRANQSPQESIDQGLASCTGLSIILTDACRSVGVPARLAGIPSWKNKRGNHTWVEVWDNDWHFTGAAEPSDQGLDHAWFQSDAALADPNSKVHSIYAVSFRQTQINFPMVWSPKTKVWAENVTGRYVAEKETTSASGKIAIMFRVWNSDKTKRVVAKVTASESRADAKATDPETNLSGHSRNNEADMNDMLQFQLKPKTKYTIRAEAGGGAADFELETGDIANQVVEILLQPRSK